MAGLSVVGFERKRLPELKSELEAGVRALDPNADLSPQSLIGQIIGTTAQVAADLWEIAEHVYLSQYPASAEGVSLEEAVSLVGISRLGASKATAVISATGEEGTVIPQGSIVRNSEGTFQTVEDMEVTADSADRVRVQVVTPLAGETYTITVGGVPISIVAATNVADNIAAQLEAEINSTPCGAEATAIGEELDIFALGNAVSVAPGVRLAVTEVAAQIRVEAFDDGSTDVAAGAINQIVTAVAGWDEVTNRWEGVDGRILESDVDLRARRRQGVRGPGSASADAMVAKLLQTVPNLLTARVYENRTGSVDGDGRPAHSFEVIVEGGDDQEVAEAIWKFKPAGIEMVGLLEREVTDASGSSQTVKFNRPVPLYIWAEVEIISYNNEETYPFFGAEQIAAAVVEAGNKLKVGEDVISQKLLAAVFSIPGLAEVELRFYKALDTSDVPGSGDYDPGNVVVAPSQRAKFAIARTAVQE